MGVQSRYRVVEVDGYRLFMPPEGSSEEGARRRRRTESANESYLREHPEAGEGKAVTGSFVYAHPPNYRGLCTLWFTESDWRRELSRLRRLGIDTVVFQASLWDELGECYYPSEVFRGYRTWNVVEPMLGAAAGLGLRVFLGGCGSVTCWMDRLSGDVVEGEKRKQLSCFRELLRYGDLFQGFYFCPESAYMGFRDGRREGFLRGLYGDLFKAIKDRRPDLRIMMSPATFHHPGRMDEMGDAWESLLEGVPLDILAPQDSIGCACIDLVHQREAIRQWKRVADARRLSLWSNVELFSVKPPFGVPDCREAADPRRIQAQIANASPYVEKLIAWEVGFYTTPAAGSNAAAIRRRIFGCE